jgi:methionine sulfoxide reductase heme-binding subunit
VIAAGLTWYVTRGSGLVALVLLTIAFVLGIPTARSSDRRLAPRLIVQLLHRNASLLAVVFLAVHVATTVADSFVHIRVVDAFVPFIAGYHTLWLGLGTIALDLMLAVVVTSLLRHRLSYRTWRTVHLAAYGCWPIALFHGLEIGSDAGFAWMRWVVAGCAAAATAAVMVRVARPVRALGAATQ